MDPEKISFEMSRNNEVEFFERGTTLEEINNNIKNLSYSLFDIDYLT